MKDLRISAWVLFLGCLAGLATDFAAVGAPSASDPPASSIPSSAILSTQARLIVDQPWGADAVTPVARAMPDDMRQIDVISKVTVSGVPVYIGAPYIRFARLQLIPAGAYLEYDIRIDPSSISNCGGFDLESVPRRWLSLRDAPGVVDQNGNGIHPASAHPDAVGVWLHRTFSLARVAGRPFGLALLSAEFTPSQTGTYHASYRNIRIVDESGKVYWNFFPELGDLSANLSIGDEGAGYLSVSGLAGVTLTPDNYAFASGQSHQLQVLARNYDPTEPEHVDITSVRLEGGSTPVLLAKRFSADLQPGETRSFTAYIGSAVPAGNYFAVADLSVGDQTVPVRSYAISIAPAAMLQQASLESRKNPRFGWGADISFEASLANLAELRQNGGNSINMYFPWNRIEVAPRKYDFTRLDHELEYVRQAHLRAELFLWTADRDFPAWLSSQAMLDQTGKPGRRFSLSYYSPTGRAAYMQLIRSIAAHFRNNDVVQGYQFPALGWGDGFFATPNNPNSSDQDLYDYSPWLQDAFRGYVRDVLHLTLNQASQRYGVTLSTWNDLKEPVYQGGVDIRPLWWDFQNFRCWTVENMWDDVCRTVRSVDGNKTIEFMCGGDLTAIGRIANDYDAAARVARKYGASIHNTCYEGYGPAQLLGAYTRLWGVRHTCETAGTPSDIPAHQQCMFNVLRYGAAGYSWVGGRPIGYYPSYAKLRPVAEEVSGARPVGVRFGIIQSLSIYQCDMNNARVHERTASTVQFAHDAGLNLELYSDRSFMAGGFILNPHDVPVVMDCGSNVLTQQAARAVVGYVRSGGTAILHASSGRFTPGDPAHRCLMLTELGYRDAPGLLEGRGRAKADGEGLLAGETISLTSISPLTGLPAGANVLARFADAQPAMASWPSGDGRVIVIGGIPNYDDVHTRDAILRLLAQRGVVPSATATGGVIAAALQKGATRYVLLHNPNNAAVTATVATAQMSGTVRAYDLEMRKSLGVMPASSWATGRTLELAPYEVTAVALDSEEAAARSFPRLDYPLYASDAAASSAPAGPSGSMQAYRPVTAWLTLGAFDNPGRYRGASFYQSRPPEAGWNPQSEYVVAGRVLAWKTATAPDGELVLTDSYPYASDRVAYAMTDLVADTNCTVRLRCGVDYALYLWLDGKPLFDSNAVLNRGPASPAEFTIETPLHAGRNRLSAKIAPGSDGWTMWMQIASPDSGAVKAELPPVSRDTAHR